ncbi:MAG TPA: hypothetical protein VJK30_05220 [Coxiellaceae bacterium]|nr:MAG: hypothetical protein A3E81_00860 [Gammaproteobacteria bacterium RIFCSPHIGHO2_12_FULL_36_30]HLB56710.1 hypothetical protein [Coxiellaceae bacterium]
METLKQTLVVPENHKIHIDVTLPDSFPTGQVEVLLVFSNKLTSSNDGINIAILQLAGVLKNSSHFGGDPLLTQKALRNEWER